MPETSAQTPAIDYRDPMVLQEFADEQKKEQKLGIGILWALAAGVGTVVLWTAAIVLLKYKLGWFSIVAALGIGFTLRIKGKGIDPVFGIAGAGVTLIVCLLGSLATAVSILSLQSDRSFFFILSKLDFGDVFSLLGAIFKPIDVMVYAFAIYAGYHFSFKQPTLTDMLKAKGIDPKAFSAQNAGGAK